MPWLILWVEPVPFTTHRGVTIYHTYNSMEATCGFHRFRFTAAASDADERFHFDVRELPVPGVAHLRGLDSEAEYAAIREIVHEAIDCGLLKSEKAPELLAEIP